MKRKQEKEANLPKDPSFSVGALQRDENLKDEDAADFPTDLSIKAPHTNKDEIKHPPLALKGVLPKLGSSILIIGKSASGKSVLMQNLIKDPRFYGNYFDEIYLCAPTAETDDILIQLELPKHHVFTNLDEGIMAIDKLQKSMRASIQKHGPGKVKQVALLMDDCIGSTQFLNSEPFLKSFIAPRHYNKTTFLSSQHLRKVPKICRMQAHCVILYPASKSEMDVYCDEYCPPGLSNKAFEDMLQDAWSEPYGFLSIHLRQPIEKRYRKGFSQIYNLDYYR
jgi:hypothetical protein